MIEIELDRGSRPGRFKVTWRGEVILASSRDPEHDACRVLLARGITGIMAARWAGSPIIASRRDIASASLIAVEETSQGLRRVPFRPYSGPRKEARELETIST